MINLKGMRILSRRNTNKLDNNDAENISSIASDDDDVIITTTNSNKNASHPFAKSTDLKIIKLGSDVGATKNMTVYECGNEIIVVDMGIGFPDSDLPGVDVIIPDISYLVERLDMVKGIVVTHGHEDHFGAIPYLYDQLNVPIYCNDLVEGFIRKRLDDRATKEVAESVVIRRIDKNTRNLKLGENFSLTAYNVNHSVPASLGFAIKTPQGTVVHMADYKIDKTPVLDDPIDMNMIEQIGNEGVLCFLSDCLGVTHKGFSESESTLDGTLDEIVKRAAGKQVFLTTISSNISRMFQIIEVAAANGRKVAFVGRSVQQSADVARQLGYLPFSDDHFIDLKKAGNYEPSQILYIVAGCYGQQGSALYRLAHEEHNQLSIMEGDYVIFSADPGPPSSYEPVESILHYLTVAGGEVIYSDIQDNLHVSGHGTREDLKLVASKLKPKYYIPIGGTAAYMRAYTHMVEELGSKRGDVFELLEGESVVFKDDFAKMGEKIKVEQIYIDGKNMEGIGEVVIKDRERLSNDGVFVVIVPMSKDTNQIVGTTEIVTRGFVYVKENKALVGRSKDVVNKVLDKFKNQSNLDWARVKNDVERDVGKFLNQETGRNPLIIVTSVSV